MTNQSQSPPSSVSSDEAEAQIVQHHKSVDYDTREYPVEVLVSKYLENKEEEENELFVPDYQREHTWPERHQSKFIESVLIGLPIPYLFVADIAEKEGRLEIVDGSQRIRTLASFLSNELVLSGLVKLSKLNGFRFQDLPQSRQRRFKRHTIRMIELTEKADDEVRRDIFERINTGSQILTDMEVRWGIHEGEFLNFIRECSEDEKFKRLAPLPESTVLRRGRQELVLRFFAYLNNYNGFERKVVDFLNEYLASIQDQFDEDNKATMSLEWSSMLDFIDAHFPNGFAKGAGHTRTPRIRYEAMAVGTALALRENPNINPVSTDWIDSKEFKSLTTSDSSNSRPKIVRRIEFVRDHILEQ